MRMTTDSFRRVGLVVLGFSFPFDANTCRGYTVTPTAMMWNTRLASSQDQRPPTAILPIGVKHAFLGPGFDRSSHPTKLHAAGGRGGGESLAARLLRRILQWFRDRVVRLNRLLLTSSSSSTLDGNATMGVDQSTTTTEKTTAATKQPQGPRWAISANTTDLSGKWKPIVTAEFKQEYDEYLQNCSQSALFRKLVMSTLGLTRDEIEQSGRNLTITGKNPAGAWARTLVSSGADYDTADFEPVQVEIKDPDSDLVQVEAWWEEQGTVHKSILRGKPRVHGGEFETMRYLESDDVLVTESLFHPSLDFDGGLFRPGFVKWRFQRES